MKHIKLIAVNLDGVLLKDTFSPVIRKLVMHFGKRYTQHIERNILSRPQSEAARYIIDISSLECSNNEIIDLLSHERNQYIAENGNGIFEETPAFLDLLAAQKTRLVCYGGLPCTYFESEMRQYRDRFDFYVCTNNFRPGLKEITRDIYNMDYSNVLFIDDVNSVAEAAKKANIPFIGCPTNSRWGFQKEEMIRTGVRHIVDTVGGITQDLLDRIDDEASRGSVWSLNKKETGLRVRGILLDFDGVISKNSVSLLLRFIDSYINRFTYFPYKILCDFFKTVTVFPIKETIGLFFRALGLSHLLPDFSVQFSSLMAFNGTSIEIEKDFHEFLDFCRSRGIDCMVASLAENTNERMKLLAGLIEPAGIIDIGRGSKADPGLYAYIAETRNISPDEWLIVDDSPLALRAAHISGFRTLMMTNDVFTDDDFAVCSDFIAFKAHSFTEIAALIDPPGFSQQAG